MHNLTRAINLALVLLALVVVPYALTVAHAKSANIATLERGQ